MGSHAKERFRERNETQHTVALEPFLMGKYEVTRSQWGRLMGQETSAQNVTDPARPLRGDAPAVDMDADGCRRFARRAGLDLPTEAQWEYAARGGSRDAYVYGPTPSDIESFENTCDRSLVRAYRRVISFAPGRWSDGAPYLAPVGTYLPNDMGLHDMLGNVTEQCKDLYDDAYPATREAPGDGLHVEAKGPLTVMRGGNWYVSPRYSRVAYRQFRRRSHFNNLIGLRVARGLQP